jgi:hypothetical protein
MKKHNDIFVIYWLVALCVLTMTLGYLTQPKPESPVAPIQGTTTNEKQATDELWLRHMEACSSNTFKSYMDYRTITATRTKQWRLQQQATTDEQGFRKIGGRYLVAVSKTYGKAGDWIVIILDGERQIDAIIGDIKSGTTCTHPDGSMLEFIVDVSQLSTSVRRSGNVNSVFPGSVTAIYQIKEEQ